VALILVRYAEIGLKSRPVRRRFEAMLRENIGDMLARDGVEALISVENSRLYVQCEDEEGALLALRRVFGVASVSVVELHEGDLEEVCAAAARYSLGKLSEGQSFAVRPRREGVHDFTSMDLGREVGSAIFLANEHLGVRVDLSNPDVEFFIELRQRRAYIFQDYLPGPGGLPLGSQGRVLASIRDDRDALAAWMMMRRGCRVLLHGEGRNELLERYDPKLRHVEGNLEEALRSSGALGVVSGETLADLELIEQAHNPELTAFHPLVGLSKEEVSKMFAGLI